MNAKMETPLVTISEIKILQSISDNSSLEFFTLENARQLTQEPYHQVSRF